MENRYIRLKDGTIYDLKSSKISSIEYIDKKVAKETYKEKKAFYCIYYYNHLRGRYLESDNKGGCSMDSFYENEILMQSDNLDELCDEFIIKPTIKLMKPYVADKFLRGQISEFGKFIFERYGIKQVYGAIYTSDGLIYVAKTNNKGGFILL